MVSALAALIIGHVLDDAENAHAQILEHLDALDDINEGEALRGGDDDCAVELELLAQTQLDVACSRGHVYYQVVQLSPMGLVDQLGNN